MSFEWISSVGLSGLGTKVSLTATLALISTRLAEMSSTVLTVRDGAYLTVYLDLFIIDILTLLTDHIYFYIYTFSRRFYPKRLTVHSGYTFVLLVRVFPGNRTHNLCAANAML